MNNIKIFCEGITDQVFIADCIELFYGKKFERLQKKGGSKIKDKLSIKIKNDIEIIDVGGCSKLTNELYLSKLRDNESIGGKNIVIFDADYSKTGTGNKGFKACEQKLNNLKTSNEIQFDFYIWPNNNDEGEIENLLRLLIPEDKETLFDCIEDHQTCLMSQEYPEINLKTPELKDKIGFYLHTMNKKSTPSQRDYKDNLSWDLDYHKTKDLNSFKIFMDTFMLVE